jgi:hypothetical protein
MIIGLSGRQEPSGSLAKFSYGINNVQSPGEGPLTAELGGLGMCTRVVSRSPTSDSQMNGPFGNRYLARSHGGYLSI